MYCLHIPLNNDGLCPTCYYANVYNSENDYMLKYNAL